MRVVVAIPTIEQRPGLAEVTAQAWRDCTPGVDVEPVISTAGESWSAGLNDVWANHTTPDVFVCGSDDMVPGNVRWLTNLLPWLDRNLYPAPRVDDPRFVNYGGHPQPVPDGTPADMSSFPVLRGDWLAHVFPLPEDLHYFADNLIAALLLERGVGCVAVPSSKIMHMHAQEGRGAGYGTENTRLYIDTVRYTRALNAHGIDRETLPDGVRGHMWQPHFQEIGKSIGA